MDPARELPYRPAAQCRVRRRIDGSIRLRATAILKFSLARKGRPQMESGPSGCLHLPKVTLTGSRLVRWPKRRSRGTSIEAVAHPMDHAAGGGIALEMILDQEPYLSAPWQRRGAQPAVRPQIPTETPRPNPHPPPRPTYPAH